MRSRNHKSHLHHLLNRQAYRQRPVNFHALDFSNLAMLFQHPELFQNLVELFFVGHRKNFLRRDFAVMKFDAPVRQPRHYGIVRNHYDGPPLLMKLPQQAQDNLLICRVEIARRFVRQNNLGIINQCPGDADALLLATREL